MTQKIFIWVGHPKSHSLCAALADAYQAGAEGAGCEVRRMNLSDMSFSVDGFSGYGDAMPPLEPDLVAWQEAITWADHLLFVHPYWWAGLPGRAKAVLDRALLPGFGFKYRSQGGGWDKLLTGKTADVIITSDTPPLLDALIYRKPGRQVMKKQVFGFCGVKTRRAVQFGTVTTADASKVGKWLGRAQKMGVTAAR